MEVPATQVLFDTLREFGRVPNEMLVELSEHIQIETFKKDSEIGPKSIRKNVIYFVAAGIVKGNYFNQLGKEVVTGFWWENMFIITKDHGTIAESEHLMFIEDTILLSLSATSIDVLTTKYSEASRLSNKLNAIERRRLRQRAEILLLPAADAYKAFQQSYPSTRIKLQDIAHFLGIRPFTLSRIRACR